MYATRTSFHQLVSTSWDCGKGPPEMQLPGGCDFSRHAISLCLGAVPEGFEKGHTAVGHDAQFCNQLENLTHLPLTYRSNR